MGHPLRFPRINAMINGQIFDYFPLSPSSHRRLASFVKILNQEDISKHQNHDTIQEVSRTFEVQQTVFRPGLTVVFSCAFFCKKKKGKNVNQHHSYGHSWTYKCLRKNIKLSILTKLIHLYTSSLSHRIWYILLYTRFLVFPFVCACVRLANPPSPPPEFLNTGLDWRIWVE